MRMAIMMMINWSV